MKLALAKGTTSYRAYVFIQNSSVTTGAGLTGLVFNSAGLVASYVRPGAARTAITLATQTVTGAYSSGGFVEVDSTNMPGVYRLDVPNAALAAGVDAVVVMLKGATNMAPLLLEVQLTNVDLNDGVRGGMTALPNANAGAAFGLPVSNAGGLDIDSLLGTLTSLAAETRDANIFDQFRATRAVVEHQRGAHTHQPIGNIFFVDPVNGDTHANGNRGGITDPYAGIQDCHDNAVTDSNHDLIILLSGAAAGATTLTEDVTLTKRYLFIRGPGRDFIWTRSTNGDTITITADGVELFGFQVGTAATGVGNGITVTSADFFRAQRLWIGNTQGHGIQLTNVDNAQILHNHFHDTGVSGSGHGLVLDAGAGQSGDNIIIEDNHFHSVAGDSVRLNPTGGGTVNDAVIRRNHITNSSGDGIDITGSGANRAVVAYNIIGSSGGLDINDNGTGTVSENNEQWSTLTAAQANAEADSALADVNLDHLVGTAAGIPAVPAGTFLDQIMDDGTATFDRTTDSLQAIRDTAPLGTAMRGTDNAALASVCTELRLAELDPANLVADVLAILDDTGTSGVIVATNNDKTGYALAADFAIKKNTAKANFPFVMIDSTDHVSGKTGLSVTATRSIDGGAFAACANAATEIANGVYNIDLAASDLNGDTVIFRFTGTGADDTLITVVTQTE